jgi:drug/metabolite transporter (DMT)-like permease
MTAGNVSLSEIGGSVKAEREGRSAAKADALEPTQSSRPTVELQAYIYVVLMVLIGSTTAPAAKYVVQDLPIFLIPVIRFAMAGTCLLPVVWARGGLGRLIRQDGWRLLLTATLCVPVNQGFFLSATRLCPTSHVGLFYATCPLVVLLLAWAMRLEQPDRARLWGVLASISGMVLIGLGNLWESGGSTPAESHDVLMGDLLLIGAVASWGCYIAVSKPLIVRNGALPVLAGTFLAGCMLAAPVAIVFSPAPPPLSQVSTSAWLALAFLGMFVTPFGWAYQNMALRRFDATQVATFSNAAPILTVIWGMWLFGETLKTTLVVGGVLTMAGIYWICRPVRTGPTAPAILSDRNRARNHGGRDGGPTAGAFARSQEPTAR